MTATNKATRLAMEQEATTSIRGKEFKKWQREEALRLRAIELGIQKKQQNKIWPSRRSERQSGVNAR